MAGLAESRKAALKRAKHTYKDVARLAGVSERMVMYWMAGARTSANVERAYRTLVNGGKT